MDLAPFLVLTRQKAKGQSPVRMARLTKNKEFQTVYKHGQVYVGRYVVLYVLPRPGQATRTGFTAVSYTHLHGVALVVMGITR